MGLICRYAGAGTSALRAFCSPPWPREGLVHSCAKRGRAGSRCGMLTRCDSGPAASVRGHCAPQPASALGILCGTWCRGAGAGIVGSLPCSSWPGVFPRGIALGADGQGVGGQGSREVRSAESAGRGRQRAQGSATHRARRCLCRSAAALVCSAGGGPGEGYSPAEGSAQPQPCQLGGSRGERGLPRGSGTRTACISLA